MKEKMQEYLNSEVIGNVRTGTRGEKDNPVKLAYFDVHIDNSTSELAVEIFNEKYNQPKSLVIKFDTQNPMDIGFQRYEGKKLKCYGNSKEAKEMKDDGKRQIIECNPKKCPYRQKGKCKMVGRLYFIIKQLEDEGVWCYPMGSEKGIRNIWRRIARCNRIGENITNDWYELYLRSEDGGMGKNYIPDIRKIGQNNNKNTDNHQESQGKETNNTNKSNEPKQTKQQSNYYLKIIKFEKAKYENKEIHKIICIDTNSKTREFFLMPESKQDILKVATGSIILPLKMSAKGNMLILSDYKIAKAV